MSISTQQTIDQTPNRYICAGFLSLSLFIYLCCSANLAFAQSESVSIKMFAPNAESGARSTKKNFSVVSRKERAVQLNEQGVELVLQGKSKAGIAKIKQALAHDPNNTTILYNLAGLYLSQGAHSKAIPLMEKVVTLDSRDLSFQHRLAEAYVAAKQLSRAIVTYEAIEKVDSGSNDVMLKLGALYGMKKRWDDAERILLKAQKLLGDDPKVLNNLGNILVVEEKYSEGIKVLSRAQEIAPNAENAVALGIAYEALGKTDDALAHYKKAEELGEKGEELKLHISEIENSLAAK